MARWTNLLRCFIAVVFFSATIGRTEQEIQDFEFADSDSDNEVEIVKRATVNSDDEDFLVDDFGSTTDPDYEGSGTTEPTSVSRSPIAPDSPRYYRVTINITNVIFTPELAIRNSREFSDLAQRIQRDIESLFGSRANRYVVTILEFRPGPLLVTFDLLTRDEDVAVLLENAIRRGAVGSRTVSPQGFEFRSLAGTNPNTATVCVPGELMCHESQVCIASFMVCDNFQDCPDGEDERHCQAQCPIYVGREPIRLPRTGNNFANLLINNAFPCDGNVIGWEYYRLIQEGTAYVGVWRQNADSEFVLVKKTALPSANLGSANVELDRGFPVQRGDFIGIFYPRSTQNNVIAQATLADDALDAEELYQTYSAQFYDDMVTEGAPFNLNSVPYISTNATFSIRAIMDYQDVDQTGQPLYSCSPNEFACNDGFCIEAEYRCDNNIDCKDFSDELNCPEEPCLEGRFRCSDGTCINRGLRCDGKIDCDDGSDELCTSCAANQFQCRTSRECVPSNVQCDGTRNCIDGSDEEGCPPLPVECSAYQFRCQDGTCISAALKCDSHADCARGEDEFRCPSIPCPSGEFRCENGKCIPLMRRCDGIPDCSDTTDELDCSCKEEEFTCADGQCIPISGKCDGSFDCDDGSDELDGVCLAYLSTVPPACLVGFFRCSIGICIEQSRVCDGTPDCPDDSDEDMRCEHRPCTEDKFRCDSGDCIDMRLQCDGMNDCKDNSDERSCVVTCGTYDFTCTSGQCIDIRHRCDKRPDCVDGSDERQCPCTTDEFECSDRQCIPTNLRCNRANDCTDGSDERDCPCREREFRCNDGQCISENRVCDRQIDCRNGEDESNCASCRRDEFQCLDGTCIDRRYRCDRIVQCPDNTDEFDCNCNVEEFRCGNGQCIPQQNNCNQRQDCFDGTDEINCPTCSPLEFTCASGQCITSAQRCDRRTDCVDGSDERNCPCASGEFTCVSDGRCLPPGYRCNGNPDCRDGSDELGCECSAQEFKCNSGQCIPLSARCDRRYDCRDSSDEFNCEDMVAYISPQVLTKRVGTSASFVCQVTSSRPVRIQWSRRTGGAMPPQAVIAENRLTITNLRVEDSGDYLCQAISSTGTIETVARLNVEYIGPPTSAPDPDGSCGRDQATCSNGQCISRDYVCDGEEDCVDKSDELNCSFALPCEPNEFRCNNNQCALKIWRCDGDKDCSDGSDEFNCPSLIPGQPCRSDEFMCKSNVKQCIPFAYQCDGEIDCQDRSDEVGCREPTIVVPPIHEITVEINGTFTIICNAVGVPTPLIVWRLNWGNIPSGDRVTVTSIDGRGVLTVRNVIQEDAGAYTCEALNNRGSIFAIPDAHIIVRRLSGVCQVPRFNAAANNQQECVRCYCFGRSQACYSSNLQLSQITLGSQVTLVNHLTQEPVDQRFVQYIPSSKEFQVTDFNNVLRTGSYYWSLPYQYLNKRLSSYGGELTYQVYYDVHGFDVPTRNPDVYITGNGITLIHKSESEFVPRIPNIIRVPLVESSFERSRDSPRDGPISEYATREDLMQVLENVTSILIRASYDNRQTVVRLGNVLLSAGVPQSTGLGRAVYVEECVCPTGYAGFSCEECAPGFYRVERGNYGRECIACNCNGYSNDCDPFTGICRNCRDNTAGPYCNECAPGYVGDPRSGRPCQPCPCPLTTPENQFSPTCILDYDGEITCNACPQGYTGRSCERCADRYKGNPLVPGDRCRPSVELDNCDQRGSISIQPIFGRCQCKNNVEGQYCDTCKEKSYYLSPDFPNGCISCFCAGITQICQSTTWNRTQISLAFSQSPTGMVLTDVMQKETIADGLSVNRQSRELVFQGFNNLDRTVRYWSLPQQFLGDKVTAYGGNLRFTIRYRAGRDNSPISLSEPIVEIGGNEITFVHRARQQIQEGRPESFSVPMIETAWYRMDGQPATREHLLMTLADLKFILVRATYTVETEESAISGISLDIAEDRNTGRERAFAVEHCVCPRGYTGLSCEDCDTGYTRSGKGLLLGFCEPCRCYGHSSECDPDLGVCRNCRHNTEGRYCERCARGYYGDATRGSINDCQKCPCPLTESPNQFSPECILNADGDVTCTACPPGHTGRRCERCVSGYQGNPNRPGDFCKLINVTCDCDARGTVPNTLCDPITQQCQCKNNVQGQRCNACKQGYFNLDSNNEMGCLRCYCSGVTEQCSSSNYYREEIIPMLNADGSHNFQLTNRRLSKSISDGFTMNAEWNEITFNSFRGIQQEQESLFFQLPPKFRGDKISSYGGYLKFGLSYSAFLESGNEFMDVDVEFISKQDKRMYYLHRPSPKVRENYNYEILLTENSFKNQQDGQTPSREAFLAVLADISAVLIRATYHTVMDSVTLRNLRIETAVPVPNGQRRAPEVESCICPEGYTGLSCQACAPGYLKVEDGGTAPSRCVRCNCHGHATSCDPLTGVCQNCQDNTVGDRCERCASGYYGDPTGGTPNDCRPCACPLTISGNQFSSTCFLDQDFRVTCDRCPVGYAGRDCGQCAPGYQGNPREPGGRCEIFQEGPQVEINPLEITEPLGSTVTFSCTPRGRGPFNVVWSRLDGKPLPRRATQGPGPNYLLIISNLEYNDAARYVCFVTSTFGTNRGYATLTVQRPDTPIKVRINEPTNIVTRPGATARFICVAVQYSSAVNYVLSWMKDGGVLPPKVIDQNGILIISNLDENDVGTYTCTGSEPGSVDKATATIKFGEFLEPPKVYIDPRYLEVHEGQSVEFQCIAEGSPAPTVHWTKGADGPLPSYIYTDKKGVFRIASFTANDISDYFCTATNSEGTAKVRTIVYMAKTNRTQVIVRRTSITAQIGTSEQLNCYAEGEGGVTLVWSKEGGLPFGATQENGVLTLTNIQPSFEGTYICTGSTPSGIVGSATARINVVGRIHTQPTVSIEPERQVISTGTTGTLRCIVTGEPYPEIRWSRSGAQLSSNHQINGEILRIVQASMNDRGYYTCTASNIAGTAHDSVAVEIERRDPPKIELFPQNQVIRPAGSNALFQCRVVGGTPAPVVTWSRSGGRLFTARTEIKPDVGVIMFTSLSVEEQGEYMCTATNDVGTITATASLRVEGPPLIEITPGNRITSVVGERVHIECIGLGDPVPSVFWRSGQRRRSDVLPEDNEAGPGTATLIFNPVQKTDEGQYICVATNERGRSEETVEVVVSETSIGSPRALIDGEGTHYSTVGQSVDLTCRAEHLHNPRIRWRRPGGLPLPPGHSVRNGVLLIPRIERDSEGEYICTITTDVGSEYSVSVFIIVNITPTVTVIPQRVTTTPGHLVELKCQPNGRGPFNIEWTKVDGDLSPGAREFNGVLAIRQITRADAGRYRCSASNLAGVTEGYADVTVLATPSIVVSPKTLHAKTGETVEFVCNVQGDPLPRISWEKETGKLSHQHRIRHGILTLYEIQPEDTGKYICTAWNDIGTTKEFGSLFVQAADARPYSTSKTAFVGDQVEFTCQVDSAIPYTVDWAKEEGPLPAKSFMAAEKMFIPDIQLEDSGIYKCFVMTDFGSVQNHIRLIVNGGASVSVQQDYKTVALGSPVQLTCDASGYPQPKITWEKASGELPDDHKNLDNGDLYIPRVRQEDGGIYICNATNQFGSSTHPLTVVVGALVPHFHQNPSSYISFSPLSDAYHDLDILLSFRPEATDGLLLYNGQYSTDSGDFVCFGLQGQYPEFRFDVGAGPAIIKGSHPLELNTWHTVHLKRHMKNGTMLVNDEPIYTGIAPGQFQGLDIAQPLYLGSVPNYNAIPKSAGFSKGFVGSISEFKIKGADINLGADAREFVDIKEYPVCSARVCLNNGSCQAYNTRNGFVCRCRQGFTGERCENTGQRCYQGACGPSGRCYNPPRSNTFSCICPALYSGEGCSYNLDEHILDPVFNKTSFISYPTIKDGLMSVHIQLLFKPRSLDDGIILYNAQRQDGKQDFIAIIIKDKHVEFRFDTGSGPAILRSRQPLKLNDWTMVIANRKGRDGMLIINNEESVNDQVEPSNEFLFARLDRGDIIRATADSDKTVGLNLERPLYLGGVDPAETINPRVGTFDGFVGCIGQLSVGDQTIDLTGDAIESLSVQNCGERTICDKQPCHNNGTCRHIYPKSYKCTCPSDFTGNNCETEVNICITNKPCYNNGICVVQNNSYRCDCPLGWMGFNCGNSIKLDTNAYFNGNSYAEFSKETLTHNVGQLYQRTIRVVFALNITTTEKEGLFLWQGQKPGEQGNSKDYVALSVENGYVIFRYELGSGKGEIRSPLPIDDGLPHHIVVKRLARDGSLKLDDNQEVTGKSDGSLQVLNVPGNVYFGGVPDLSKYTGNLYSQNLVGCISDVRIMNQNPINFGNDSLSGFNVEPCIAGK